LLIELALSLQPRRGEGVPSWLGRGEKEKNRAALKEIASLSWGKEGGNSNFPRIGARRRGEGDGAGK